MLFYRVQHPDGLGLWYNSQGEYTYEIGKAAVRAKGLDMSKDTDCEGGWLSCTTSFEDLMQWWTTEEMLEMEELGYEICIFKATKYRKAIKYDHWLFHQEGSELIGKIKIEIPC